MTVENTNRRNDYPGTGTTDTFPYTFKITQDEDILVVEVDDAGIMTELILNTDYTVTGAGDLAGGNVVRTAGNLPTGYNIALILDPEFTQRTDLRNQGEAFRQTMEDALDRNVQMILRQQVDLDLCVKAQDGEAGADLTLPALEADKFLKIDGTGKAIELVTGSPATGVIQTVGTTAELIAALQGTDDILIAAGTYALDLASVAPNQAVKRTIRGESMQNTILQLSGSTGFDFVAAVGSDRVDGVSLQNLTLENVGTVAEVLKNAVGCADVLIKDAGTTAFYGCTKMTRCVAQDPGTYGFHLGTNFDGCHVYDGAGAMTAGFYLSTELSSCRVRGIAGTTYGFQDTKQMSGCQAYGTDIGFFDCKEMGECRATLTGGDGFNVCDRMSTSAALTPGQHGFNGCTRMTCCYTQTVTGTGFRQCVDVHQCEAQNVGAASYHFDGCTNVLLPTIGGTGLGFNNNTFVGEYDTIIDRANYASDTDAGTALKTALENSNIRSVFIKYSASNYEIGATTTVTANKLIHAELGATILMNGANIQLDVSAGQIECRNLIIDGNDVAGVSATDGIVKVGTMPSVHFYNCIVKNSDLGSNAAGITGTISSSSEPVVGGFWDCTVEDCYVGMYQVANVFGGTLQNCTDAGAVNIFNSGGILCSVTGTTAATDGFRSCFYLNGCTVVMADTATIVDAFKTCRRLSDCKASGVGITNGFNLCFAMSACEATFCANDGFVSCTELSGCVSEDNTDDGFLQCNAMSGCRAEDNGGDGFQGCENISAYRATGNTGWGMRNCSQIAAGDCTGNTAGTYTGSTLQDAGSTK
jgi:hypothetical protein